jgi:hypothetical protein
MRVLAEREISVSIKPDFAAVVKNRTNADPVAVL